MPYTITAAQPVKPPLQRRPPDPGDATVHINANEAIFNRPLNTIQHLDSDVFADHLEAWGFAALFDYWWRRRGRFAFHANADVSDDYEYAKIQHTGDLFSISFISRHPGRAVALDEHGRVIPDPAKDKP